jgi:hypothetical protein
MISIHPSISAGFIGRDCSADPGIVGFRDEVRPPLFFLAPFIGRCPPLCPPAAAVSAMGHGVFIPGLAAPFSTLCHSF